MLLSPKQKDFWLAPFHRWNIKYGGTRTGKTYLDYYMIPRRIQERRGKDGLVVLLGNTRGTLQRNVIDPMQQIYGIKNISDIRADNTATIFRERVYCLGADNIKHVDRLRGSSIKYAYGDEIVTWNEEVFEMLKSRLDKPYSCFDGTCNPKDPEHWVKRFLDSDADIFSQQYSLFDNPFLDECVKEEMMKEHKGVFYGRYILGLWTVAEGLVFPYFAENETPYLTKKLVRQYSKLTIGVDFGGNGSATSFHATGYENGYERLIVIDEAALPVTETIDSNKICDAFVSFYRKIMQQWGRVNYVFCDCAAPTLINSLVSACKEVGLPYRNITGCHKNEVAQRPITVDRLLNTGRLLIAPQCKNIRKALSSLRWDEKKKDSPEDKNIGNINDYWDSFCYTWLDFVDYIDRWEKIG